MRFDDDAAVAEQRPIARQRNLIHVLAGSENIHCPILLGADDGEIGARGIETIP